MTRLALCCIICTFIVSKGFAQEFKYGWGGSPTLSSISKYGFEQNYGDGEDEMDVQLDNGESRTILYGLNWTDGVISHEDCETGFDTSFDVYYISNLIGYMFEEDESEKELSIRFGSFIDSTSGEKKHITINLENDDTYEYAIRSMLKLTDSYLTFVDINDQTFTDTTNSTRSMARDTSRDDSTILELSIEAENISFPDNFEQSKVKEILLTVIRAPSEEQNTDLDSLSCYRFFDFGWSLRIGDPNADEDPEVHGSGEKVLTNTNNQKYNKQELSVFPNPTAADGIVNLSKEVTFNVFDSKGNLQLSGEGKEIDVSQLTPGIYIIHSGREREKLIVK